MTMRPGATARKSAQQEYRHIHVALIGADELVRASLKRQIVLTNTVHPDASMSKRATPRFG
jgi:hypothetical protein